MTEREFTIPNRLGLHARPAALFVREAGRFKSRIAVVKEGLEVNGKSVMGLMLLAAEKGSKIVVRADGPDEEAVIHSIGKLVANGFGED